MIGSRHLRTSAPINALAKSTAFLAAGLPIGLVLAILASIYFGVATPSEGGAVGVAGALLLGLAKDKLTGRNLRQAMDVAGILCSCVIFLLLGASFFTLVFRGLDGHLWRRSPRASQNA